MAGTGTDIRSGISSRARSPFAAALGGLIAAVAVLSIPGAASPPPAEAQVICPPLSPGLSPSGPGPTRFTMLIRINTQGNVDTYAKPEQGMGDRLRPQDIFVLNTRFTGNGSGSQPPMTPAVAADYASQLRAAFPCNRIITLNGMTFDPNAPGYAFTGIDDPNVFALFTDFEEGDWNAGRILDPARAPWTDNFKNAFPRIKAWDGLMAGTAAVNPVGAGKRTGLVPQDNSSWNFGQIAQDLNKKNSRLGARKLGPMSVQAQEACASGGAAGYGARAKTLRLQYKFKFITKKVKVPGKKKKKTVTMRRKFKKKAKPILENLGMQISFTEFPNPSSSMPLLRTSAAQAAGCVPPALKQGMGAFFFFASDDAMRLLFQQPQIAFLRPPTT
jgi:hypothetical protein